MPTITSTTANHITPQFDTPTKYYHIDQAHITHNDIHSLLQYCW